MAPVRWVFGPSCELSRTRRAWHKLQKPMRKIGRKVVSHKQSPLVLKVADRDDIFSSEILDTPSSSASTDSFDEEQDYLLCLKCRGEGHTIRTCARRDQDEFSWFYSPDRDNLKVSNNLSKEQNLCTRCERLDLVAWLDEDLPLVNDRDLDEKPELLDDPSVCRR